MSQKFSPPGILALYLMIQFVVLAVCFLIALWVWPDAVEAAKNTLEYGFRSSRQIFPRMFLWVAAFVSSFCGFVAFLKILRNLPFRSGVTVKDGVVKNKAVYGRNGEFKIENIQEVYLFGEDWFGAGAVKSSDREKFSTIAQTYVHNESGKTSVFEPLLSKSFVEVLSVSKLAEKLSDGGENTSVFVPDTRTIDSVVWRWIFIVVLFIIGCIAAYVPSTYSAFERMKYGAAETNFFYFIAAVCGAHIGKSLFKVHTDKRSFVVTEKEILIRYRSGEAYALPMDKIAGWSHDKFGNLWLTVKGDVVVHMKVPARMTMGGFGLFDTVKEHISESEVDIEVPRTHASALSMSQSWDRVGAVVFGTLFTLIAAAFVLAVLLRM